MTIANSAGSFASDADTWLRTFQGVLVWKGTVSLALILAAGSLWNVSLAEWDEKKLHDIAGIRLKNGMTATEDEKIAEHETKASTMELKASARVWSAVALVLGALAYFVKPHGC